MSSYNLAHTPRFEKRLNELTSHVQDRIKQKLQEFQKQINDYSLNPRQHNNTKFIAQKRTWRLRIGKYRAFFDILDGEIRFTTILHRDKAYE